ncbi:MAG: COX15/CtaA family protein, partial [Bdellovibrionales bacterium]|nr:COX15/CtaA family protein [Bdellovibrionales bacterium]
KDFRRLYRFGLVTLAFTIFVILWGALVRATGSGAGCGQHWPLCNGEVLPIFSRYQTLIEFTHRLTSGLSLLLVFGSGYFAFRLTPRGHVLRRLAFWSMVAITIEALIGAALVLLRLVEHDRSVDRAISIMLHLGNTCFLVGALALMTKAAHYAWLNSGSELPIVPRPSPSRKQGVWTLLGFVLLAAAGALTALGDTLFEVSSFQEGWIRDWAKEAHFLERLRVFHPVFALAWLALAISWLLSRGSVWAKRALVLALTNMIIGGINVLLAAPIYLQIIHLLAANLLWVTLVFAFVSMNSEDNFSV